MIEADLVSAVVGIGVAAIVALAAVFIAKQLGP